MCVCVYKGASELIVHLDPCRTMHEVLSYPENSVDR